MALPPDLTQAQYWPLLHCGLSVFPSFLLQEAEFSLSSDGLVKTLLSIFSIICSSLVFLGILRDLCPLPAFLPSLLPIPEVSRFSFFPVKGRIADILDTVGHMVSVTTIQLCNCCGKAAINNM